MFQLAVDKYDGNRPIDRDSGEKSPQLGQQSMGMGKQSIESSIIDKLCSWNKCESVNQELLQYRRNKHDASNIRNYDYTTCFSIFKEKTIV